MKETEKIERRIKVQDPIDAASKFFKVLVEWKAKRLISTSVTEKNIIIELKFQK